MSINKSPLHPRAIKKEIFYFLLFLLILSFSNFYVIKGEEMGKFEILAVYKENEEILKCYVEIKVYGTSIETLNFSCPEFEIEDIHVLILLKTK